MRVARIANTSPGPGSGSHSSTPNVTPDIRSTVSQECTCSSPRPPSPLTRRRRRHLSRRCRPPSTPVRHNEQIVPIPI